MRHAAPPGVLPLGPYRRAKYSMPWLAVEFYCGGEPAIFRVSPAAKQPVTGTGTLGCAVRRPTGPSLPGTRLRVSFQAHGVISPSG
jgi:hypothetical protein